MDVRRFIDKWDLKNWIFTGFILQIIVIFLIDFIYRFLPDNTSLEYEKISLTTEMSFIEYQEPQITSNAQAKELSDKIIETTKQTKQEEINWQNAVDPTLDFNQRYAARISVNISPDDYPERAKRSNLGKVKVSVALYINAEGKIKDVKIRSIESSNGNIEIYKPDFVQAIRKIFLQKSKLLNKPYQVNGEYKDFIWYTNVIFTLE